MTRALPLAQRENQAALPRHAVAGINSRWRASQMERLGLQARRAQPQGFVGSRTATSQRLLVSNHLGRTKVFAAHQFFWEPFHGCDVLLVTPPGDQPLPPPDADHHQAPAGNGWGFSFLLMPIGKKPKSGRTDLPSGRARGRNVVDGQSSSAKGSTRAHHIPPTDTRTCESGLDLPLTQVSREVFRSQHMRLRVAHFWHYLPLAASA